MRLKSPSFRLSRRRRRRTFAQNLLLIKLKRQQAAIIRKERTAFRRTHKLSRVAEREKAANSLEQENGKICPDKSNINGEHNAVTLEGCDHRRSGKAKKSEKCTEYSPSQKKIVAKARRKHRRRRNHEIGPHSIAGSVNEYFESLQVLPFARYRQLRAEYVSLRRESDRQFRNHVREQLQLMQPTKLSRQELSSKLAACRDVFWCANPTE
ncbi:hypothetical protein OESDEN_24568 [Oesophagostomum dentatum]|uniref:Uncharacterized protein n=1 Tax=Oesophagostomum dentatum TaxID=61180 RepID=A0A0B1RVZ6_OESDE|nr:hypothetical protein OESDEN_24568 [Oesophagostomum dentatum]